jgi:hypothetical protein
VPHTRSPLASAVAHLCDANRALRLRLEENEGLMSTALAMTSEGVSAPAILDAIDVHAAQQAADEAMVVLFDARDRVRKVAIGEGLEDGMSVEQLAQTFHLSPDQIGAYVAERSNRFTPANASATRT